MTAAGTWKLVIEQLEPRSGLASGDEVELSESEAIELIASGFAWPAERPSEPAYTLLEDLQAKVGNIELLGPCIENERQIKAVHEALFTGNLRRSFVEDRSVNWVQGKIGLRDIVGRRLSQSKHNDFDLFALFRCVTFTMAGLKSVRRSELERKIHAHEYGRRRSQSANDPNRSIFLAGLSEPWLTFTVNALNLAADFECAIVEALRQGRILACQEARGGDIFLHPRVAASRQIKDFDDSYWFALSSELPLSIVKKMPPVGWLRERAKEWMEELYEHYKDSGRRFTGSDAQTVAQEKLEGLTPNSARDAWRAANFPKKEFSNPKSNIKIPIEEIREFKGTRG